VRTVVLLFCSNVFMTFAWYGHLKTLQSKPVYVAILLSWGIAFFEYVLMVPANRIGVQYFTVPQLKVMQEVITMVVFAGCALFYLGVPLKLDYLWAGMCLLGAVFFLFRAKIFGS
jgi:hypothetical protein